MKEKHVSAQESNKQQNVTNAGKTIGKLLRYGDD